MVHSKEECKTCYRFSVCGDINRSYVDFETGKIIPCPCMECIVRPMCTRMICSYIMSYYKDKYESDIQTAVMSHYKDKYKSCFLTTALKPTEGGFNNVILTKRM